jgi:hypothetical protein
MRHKLLGMTLCHEDRGKHPMTLSHCSIEGFRNALLGGTSSFHLISEYGGPPQRLEVHITDPMDGISNA